MRVKVIFRGNEKEVEMAENSSVFDLMKEMKMHPDVTIAMVDGQVVPEDMPLLEGMVVELITVVSGG